MAQCALCGGAQAHARGELVKHALLVGLGVRTRRHSEERVEAQQHLREYSEYQRPPTRQHLPIMSTRVPDAPYAARRAAAPPDSAAPNLESSAV